MLVIPCTGLIVIACTALMVIACTARLVMACTSPGATRHSADRMQDPAVGSHQTVAIPAQAGIPVKVVIPAQAGIHVGACCRWPSRVFGFPAPHQPLPGVGSRWGGLR